MSRTLPLLTLLLCASASAGLRADIAHDTPPGQATMRVYDGGKLLFQARAQGLNAVTESNFSPDGRWLVNIADGSGYVQLWDVAKGERVKTFLAPNRPRLLKANFTPDSQRLLLNFWGEPLTTEQQRDWGQYHASFWTLEPLQRLEAVSGKVWWDSYYSGNVQFDAAGQRMVTASYRRYEGQAAAVWNARTGQRIATLPRLPYPQGAAQTGGAGSVDARLSPDGSRALVEYMDGRLAEYDAGTGKLLKLRGKFSGADAGAELEQFAREGR